MYLNKMCPTVIISRSFSLDKILKLLKCINNVSDFESPIKFYSIFKTKIFLIFDYGRF